MRTLSLFLLAACSDYEYASLERLEVFEQPGELAKADVLFVIDNSASMDEEQALLGTNFSAFVEILADSASDWQIGVITTDTTASDSATLRGGILTPATPDVVGAFQDAVGVGTTGSRDEQGLWAAVLAAEPGRNPGFLRPGAVFNTVFVSDEDDHSPATVQSYLESLATAAGAGGFASHALVGALPTGCVSGTSAADPGSRYLEAATITGGYFDSICAGDYTPLLTKVGLDVAGWNSVFPLKNIPAEESLAVAVDDVAIPERETDGWQYHVGENAIVFVGRAIPRPGMTITVTYRPWVGPPE